MRRYSLKSAAVLIAIIALAISVFATNEKNKALKKTNAELTQTTQKLRCIVVDQGQVIVEHQAGAAYLIDLARIDGGVPKLFQLLDAIPPKYFRCRSFDLTTPHCKLLWFSESPFEADLSDRAAYSASSVCVLFNEKSNEIIDYLSDSPGLLSLNLSRVPNEASTLEWGSTPGDLKEYLILPSGFVRVAEERVGSKNSAE